jgi:hypothetical protein
MLLIFVNDQLTALDCARKCQQPTNEFVRPAKNIVPKPVALPDIQNHGNSPENAPIPFKPRF